MAEKKEKRYVSDNAQLMKEWYWERNSDIEATNLSANSHVKVWWKCDKGHEWQAAVSKRTLGQKCPFCSGKKAWKGFNDLPTTNPELVSEWDFSKNEESIYKYRPMSNKKVWWVCSNGHSWEAAISKRVSGENCPICQGKQILVGFNDLTTTHPKLAQEWDYDKNIEIFPEEFSKGSMAKIWWKCKLNHSWQASIYSRTSGTGCPVCAKELQSSFPEKAVFFYVKKMCPDAIANYKLDISKSLELDIFIPSLQVGIEYDGERWHRSIKKDLNKNKLCSELGIILFRIREPDCPTLLDGLSICIVRENKKKDLDKTINRLLDEMCKISNIECTIDVNLERDTVFILELLTSSRKENSINLQNSKLLDEWDYEKNGMLLPSMVTAGSDKKVWWICSQGHSYQATISSRTRGRGCPVCAGKKILKGFNDFKSKYPELAKDWDYTKNDITPDMVSYGSDKKVWWVCEKGHSYQCSISNRRSGQACPICSNKKVLEGFNDLNTTHPQIIIEWDYEHNHIQPTAVTAGSHKNVWWICSTCGREWIATIYNRTSGHGCPYCSGRKKQ